MAVQWGKTVTDLSQAEGAAREGFEFLQLAGDLVWGLSGDRFPPQEALPADLGLPFTVCAVPLPADVRVTQRGFNLYVWMEHLKHALQRLGPLGCRRLVWSNGRARVLPVEGELAVLKEQVLQFLFMLCEVAGNFDMSVLVEPLGPRRTNFLNSMKEVGEFLPRVGKENLSSLVSLREMEPIGLSPSDLGRYRELIGHVQLENPGLGPERRVSPRPDDGYDYRPFLRALKGMGYSGYLSLPADADAAALDYCRRLWEE
jgi:sugar phosphate isomerase/epimerase